MVVYYGSGGLYGPVFSGPQIMFGTDNHFDRRAFARISSRDPVDSSMGPGLWVYVCRISDVYRAAWNACLSVSLRMSVCLSVRRVNYD